MGRNKQKCAHRNTHSRNRNRSGRQRRAFDIVHCFATSLCTNFMLHGGQRGIRDVVQADTQCTRRIVYNSTCTQNDSMLGRAIKYRNHFGRQTACTTRARARHGACNTRTICNAVKCFRTECCGAHCSERPTGTTQNTLGHAMPCQASVVAVYFWLAIGVPWCGLTIRAGDGRLSVSIVVVCVVVVCVVVVAFSSVAAARQCGVTGRLPGNIW